MRSRSLTTSMFGSIVRPLVVLAMLATPLALMPATAGASAPATNTPATLAPSPNTTWTVTTTTDCGVIGCGSLSAAIQEANASGNPGTIVFAEGVTGTIQLAVDLPVIQHSLTITGPGSGLLAVNAADIHRCVMTDIQTLGELAISGLSFVNCVEPNGGGGAIDANQFGLTLRDVHATSNRSGGIGATMAQGGAVRALTASPVIIEDCTFAENRTSVDPGGEQHGGNLYISAASIRIVRSSIILGTSDLQGGMYLNANGAIEIEDSEIADNLANVADGAGVIVGQTISMLRTKILANHAAHGIAAVLVNAYTNITMTDVRIAHNGDESGATNAFGGGYVVSSDAILDRVTVDHNSGAQVGGLFLLGNTTVTNSTISNNVGIGVVIGGQLVTDISPDDAPPAGTATIRHTTITNNTADGIVTAVSSCVGEIGSAGLRLSLCEVSPSIDTNDATATLDHVIVHGNALFDAIGGITASWSIIGTATPEVLIEATTRVGIDPLLGPLECVTDLACVRPVLVDTPAWNTGDPTFVGPPNGDQLGQPRIVDIVDIGAYENQTPAPAPVPPAFTG